MVSRYEPLSLIPEFMLFSIDAMLDEPGSQLVRALKEPDPVSEKPEMYYFAETLTLTEEQVARVLKSADLIAQYTDRVHSLLTSGGRVRLGALADQKDKILGQSREETELNIRRFFNLKDDSNVHPLKPSQSDTVRPAGARKQAVAANL